MTRDPELHPRAALPPEARVAVRVNDRVSLEWHCTPADLSPLAIGWLVCEGVIRTADEIAGLVVHDALPGDSARVSVEIAEEAEDRLVRVLAASNHPSTGQMGPGAPLRDSDESVTGPAGEVRSLLEDGGRLAAWFSDMFAAAELRSEVGGVHTGGLVTGGSLGRVVEDVSRHHVIDRLVGSAFLDGLPLGSSIFLVSARISAAMAEKAGRAGVGALVSRSVPTDLAVSVAGGHGLILVGRARREHPCYFWPARSS